MRYLLVTMWWMMAMAPAWAGGLAPWTFGMSREQVTALTAQGPYKAFRNGDLETYAGQFNGVQHNMQFYFNDGALWRISVNFYEGNDAQAARAGWKQAYAALAALYGPVEARLASQGQDPAAGLDTLADHAAHLVETGRKVQMAPVHQPREEMLFSSYQRHAMGDDMLYRVVILIDPASTPPARVASMP